MIDSLLPFQVPRRSGIALCCAAAGATASVANTTMQASFDMAEILQAFALPVQSPYRDQRGDGREQEEPGKNSSLNIPLQQAGEIIEHVGAERKCKAVDVRVAFWSGQDCYDCNSPLQTERNDSQVAGSFPNAAGRATEYAVRAPL